MKLISSFGSFLLIELPDRSSERWRSMKVIKVTGSGPNSKEKRFWSVGWNGNRLSENQDTKHLEENYPDIMIWVRGVLMGQEHRP